MSEDKKEILPEDAFVFEEEVEEGTATVVVEEDEVSPMTQKALTEGWVPKEDFKGDEDSWVEAKEFVFRGELMDRIKKQSGVINSLSDQTKDLKDALKVLGEHNKKLANVEYKKAIATLKKEKVDALEERDHGAVLEIDEQIDELKEAQKDVKEQKDEVSEEVAEAPPQVIAWLESPKNSWFNTDIIMRGAADALAGKYIQENPGDFDGMLNYMEKEIRKEFPAKFGIEKPASNAVGSSDGRGKGRVASKERGKKHSPRDLDEEQYAVGKTFVNQGVYKNMQEWVDELAKTDQL